MPLLRPALVSRLLELSGGFDACVPCWTAFRCPTCAVYAKSLAARARSLVVARELRASALADDLRTRRVAPDELRDVDPELESFLDCDTPERLRGGPAARGLRAWAHGELVEADDPRVAVRTGPGGVLTASAVAQPASRAASSSATTSETNRTAAGDAPSARAMRR